MRAFEIHIYMQTLERAKRHRLAGYPLGRGHYMEILKEAHWIRMTEGCFC